MLLRTIPAAPLNFEASNIHFFVFILYRSNPLLNKIYSSNTISHFLRLDKQCITVTNVLVYYGRVINYGGKSFIVKSAVIMQTQKNLLRDVFRISFLQNFQSETVFLKGRRRKKELKRYQVFSLTFFINFVQFC